MMRSVSIVSGTSGISHDGRFDGSRPSSPTSGTFQPPSTAATVSTAMATSGAGIAVVSLGSATITRMPTATIGYTSHGTPSRCGIWDRKIRMASALTKPTMTLRGTNRITLATPRPPSTSCSSPARITAAIR